MPVSPDHQHASGEIDIASLHAQDSTGLLDRIDRAVVWELPVRARSHGLTHRDGVLLHGPAGWGDDAQERSLAAALPGRVHVLGRLSDEELAAAYRGARVFVFPSIWEGFGLPVLEAMAYGVPVVTSAGTCMAEVCGQAGLLADPTSPREIAGLLTRAIGAEHDELVEAGRERARTFTWEACAAAHTEVYHALIGGAV